MCLGSASDWFCHEGNLLQPIMQKHYPGLGSEMSSVWNFYRRHSEGKLVVASQKVSFFLLFSQITNILFNNHNEGWSSLNFSETLNCVNFTLEEKWVNNKGS